MQHVDDTCNKDSDEDVDMKDDEVSLNIINNLFLPVLCGIVVHKEKRVKLYLLIMWVTIIQEALGIQAFGWVAGLA